MAINEVEREIVELWTKLNRLKKNKGLECEKSRKKIMKAYVLLVISWMLFLFIFVFLM